MFKRFFEGIIYKLDNANIIRLAKGYHIPDNVMVRGSRISGKVTLKGNNRIQGGVKIYAKSNIEIGEYTSLNGPNTDVVSDIFPVKIGSFCSIARNVSIQEANHFTERASTYHVLKNIFNNSNDNNTSKGEIVIGNDVWIGTQSVVLSGARIGDGVIIAANSVVIGDIPSYAIAAGSPARVIKFRFDNEIIKKLMEIKWWDWEIEKIRRNRAFFEETLTLESFRRINSV
jgi:virginiamycin A acetyltransferase